MGTNNNTFGTNIELATEKLKAEELVSFATETVYGLGADAESLFAVKKVFSAKGRPTDHPLIVHIASVDKLEYWAKDIPADAYKLARHFWPGPLTLILKKQDHVLDAITGGQDTIALRVPRHPLTLSLLRNFNGLVGPSANKYGKVSPTRASHVLEDFDTEISYVLDGGACDVGIESTIIDCTSDDISVLRAGIISEVELSQVLQRPVQIKEKFKIKVPGAKLSHYAPSKPLFVVSYNEIISNIELNNLKNKKMAILSFNKKPSDVNLENCYWYKIENDPISFSKYLYKNMRDMDKLDVDELFIERPKNSTAWRASLDRLARASKK